VASGTLNPVGKNNKARRAAKAKVKAQTRAQRTAGGPQYGSGHHGPGQQPPKDNEPLFTQSELVTNLWLIAARAFGGNDEQVARSVSSLAQFPSTAVDAAAEDLLIGQINAIWANGWQPTELVRQGRRGCSSASASRLINLAVAIDHANRRANTLDSRWIAQVDGLGLPAVNGRPGWIDRWVDEEALDRAEALGVVVDALNNLLRLGPLEPVLPPPGSDHATPGSNRYGRTIAAFGAQSDPVLVRIRALLAQAESTSFEAEAIAFTAKAQELMTRHAIDVALVTGGAGLPHEQPVQIRVPIDPPYADAKSLLLQIVAEAGRCRAVFHPRVALSTIVGLPGDVAGVELLFTSLLIQAQTALADAARHSQAGGRTRTQSYRSAFLLAYSGRIRDRLTEINEAVYAEVEAEQGSAFLPVLRAQSDVIDEFMSTQFGEMVSAPVRGGYDAAGWASGRAAADMAQLSFGDLTENDQ
jgi:hypothetical protein